MTSDVSHLLHDPTRLAALHNLGLLDTPPDPAFDRLTHLAALTIKAPIALVVLLDVDRQFFMSGVGLQEPWASRRETPLSHSFCQHTLGSDEPLIVDDARRDPTLITNLAISDLGVIAYLGIPLRTGDGYAIGSICVIDSQPRTWTPREVHILEALASLAMAEIDGRCERRERKRVEAMLQHAHDELERRVYARTMELTTVNSALHAEITERKRAEEALRVSELRYRMLIEQSPLSIQIVAPDGRIRQVNRAWEDLWGVTLDQIPEYNLLQDPQLVATGVMPYIRRALAGEAVEIPPNRYDPNATLPDRTRHADPQRWVRTMIYPVKDRNGRIREIVVIHENITERKWAEDRLHLLADASSVLASSIDYETTLSSVANLLVPHVADYCMVHVLEDEGQYRQVAAAHVDPAQVALLDEFGRVYRLDVDNPHSLVTRTLRTGKPVLLTEAPASLGETVVRDAAVRRIYHALNPASLIIVPLVAHGRVLGTITCATLASRRHYGPADLGLVEDLARRAAVAVENARLYRDAQHALTMRDEFLSIAAHELKTPLTTLLGHTQSLQRRMARAQTLSERDQRVLQTLVDQVLRLDRQIETLLDVTRIELGQFQLECRPLDLCLLAHRVVAELAMTTERHPLSLQCMEETLIVPGDEQRLGEVLQNLLQNAIKYSPMGGPITIRVEQREGQASIAVTDKGIGIPEAARAHLFERFYRASNTSDHSIMGTGIGLYLVNEIVTRHGGVVDVHSTEGQGSTFTILLPLMAGTA